VTSPPRHGETSSGPSPRRGEGELGTGELCGSEGSAIMALRQAEVIKGVQVRAALMLGSVAIVAILGAGAALVLFITLRGLPFFDSPLEPWARPAGFQQLWSGESCGNGHNAQCASVWLYASHDVTTLQESLSRLEGACRQHSWQTYPKGAAGEWQSGNRLTCSPNDRRCISYSDGKDDVRLSTLDVPDGVREKLKDYRVVLQVSRGGCG